MSYEAWGEPEEYPECPHCEENARITDELAKLVARLAHSLRKAAPEHDLPAMAADYLQRNGLCGSPLREAQTYGPDNPPRLRKPGESVEEYRAAMGWRTMTPNA